MSTRKTTEQMNLEIQEKFPFIEMLGEYTGANDKTLIRCNRCGYEWNAVPRSVKNSKHGCPKCGVANGLVLNSLLKFLNKYDSSLYELVDFVNYNKVTVKCKKCGFLRTTNANNIYRFGCPKCGIEKTHLAQRLTQEEFIEKAISIHGNKYDYSKVEYYNHSTPIIIICPKHGEFAQIPSKHLLGLGCPKCIGRNRTTLEFINDSLKIHGDFYDYSKTEYIDHKTPVTIICPKHGEFKLLPRVHSVIGCGCPKCKRSHGETLVSNILELYNIYYEEQYLIKNPYNNTNFIVDFYLPKFNSIIEFNGKQHYMPVERFGGVLSFEKQKQRDEYLRQYCSENNIKLLEIKYDVLKVEELIKNFVPCN